MVGRAIEAPVARRTRVGDDRLRARRRHGARVRPACANVSLALRAGEITAIAGVSGNGQQALADVLCGLRRAGRRHDCGRAAARLPPGRAPGSPRTSRAFPRIGTRSARSATCRCGRTPWPSTTRTRFARAGLVRRHAARAHARAHRRALRRARAARGIDAPARALSGGNLQKLILGRALTGASASPGAHVPALIVAAQPTWGLDVGAVAFVHQRLLDACARGAAVLLISEDLDEIDALADRIAVMHAGRLTEAQAGERVDARGDRARDGGRRRPHDAHRAARRAVAHAGWSPRRSRRSRSRSALASLFVALGRRAARPHLRRDLRRRLRLALRVERDADARDAADPHRARGGGRVSRAASTTSAREGQLYAGALAAVASAGRPRRHRRALLFAAMLAAAMLAGALLLLVPALLRTRLGVDEVVTTLLLNFIVLLFVSMMLDGPMKDPTAMGWPQSVTLPDELQLGKLIERTRVHTGLLIALALAGVLWALLRYTTFGFAVRAVGANARAAAFVGVPVQRTLAAGRAAVGRARRARRRDRGRRAAPAT